MNSKMDVFENWETEVTKLSNKLTKMLLHFEIHGNAVTEHANDKYLLNNSVSPLDQVKYILYLNYNMMIDACSNSLVQIYQHNYTDANSIRGILLKTSLCDMI